MTGDEKVAAREPHPLQRSQKTGVHRLHRSAALADDVIVMAIGKAEIGGTIRIDLLHKASSV